VRDPHYAIFGCCDAERDCVFRTAFEALVFVCIQNVLFVTTEPSRSESPIHESIKVESPANKYYSIGNWSCVTEMIPGAQAYLQVDCGNVPATVSVQPTVNGDTTTYLLMLYENYMASGATARYTTTSNDGAAATTSVTLSNANDSANSLVSSHQGIIISVAVTVGMLIVLGCCIGYIRC
jgi:hypothetical protein